MNHLQTTLTQLRLLIGEAPPDSLKGKQLQAIETFLRERYADLERRVEKLGLHYSERRVDTSSHDDSFEDGGETMQKKVLNIIKGDSN